MYVSANNKVVNGFLTWQFCVVEPQFIKNLTKESADIYLYDEIGYGINAQSFVNELNWLVDESGVSLVNVRINSPGGSVFDGLGIFAAITNSKVAVHTYIDGVAASAAGFIAMAGKKRYMVSHGQLMMHNVSAGSSSNPEEQKKIDSAIAALEDSIAIILSNNSGLSKDEIKAKMNKETWINANEALELKFIDGVYDNTPKKRMAKNELMAFVNSIQKPKNIVMKNVLKALNLNEEVNETVAVDAVEALNEKVKTLEKENKELKEKNEAFEAEKKQATENQLTVDATKEVEEAINAGKFPEDKKADLVVIAKNDLTAFKNLVGSIKSATAPDLSKMLNKDKTEGEDRSAWTMRDWEKKDPKGLEKMSNETPELFKELFDKQYGNIKN